MSRKALSSNLAMVVMLVESNELKLSLRLLRLKVRPAIDEYKGRGRDLPKSSCHVKTPTSSTQNQRFPSLKPHLPTIGRQSQHPYIP